LNENKKMDVISEPTSVTATTSGSSSLETWRKENKIVVLNPTDAGGSKEKITDPVRTFDEARSVIHNELIDHCLSKKFEKPSPIQAQSWSILAQDQDVVGIAETGSGKTLAFALPALTHIFNRRNSNKAVTRMLVLAPTRELAVQSQVVIEEFGAACSQKMTSLTIYGGVSKSDQIRILNSKNQCPDVVVATPGRLIDLLNSACPNMLSNVSYLVLDEADRMLDMGFEEDVRRIISKCMDKEERRTAMFSATWPAAIQKLASEYLNNPVRVYVGFEAIVDPEGGKGDSTGAMAVNDSLSANKRVKQTVEVIEDRARETQLPKLLKKYHNGKNRVLIFALYKKEAERLENNLRRGGWNCCSIHGNKGQDARTAALEQFKAGSCPLMIATDVASRGLDIPNVEVVINYTFPLTIEDYVHRIGRTGRAGKTGISHTFFQPGDKSHAGELQQVMRQADQPIPDALMKFGSTIKKKEHKLYGNFGPRGDVPMKKATKILFD